MVTRFTPLVFATILTLCLCLPQSVAAEDVIINPAFRSAVKQFLLVQNTPKAVENQLTYSIAQQALSAIAANGVQVTEPIQRIVLDEARKSFGSKFNEIDYLTNLYAPLYAKHYSEKELRELIAFWRSPVGKKTMDLMPEMTEGWNAILQKESTEYVAAFQEAVDKRLAAAGIELDP